MSTRGDRLFEAFCSLRGVGYQRIPETRSKRPDYRLQLGTDRLIVEVKTLEPNAAEREILQRRSRGEIVAGGGTPGERLRREVRSANSQLKALWAEERCPTLLVVFNNTGCDVHTDPYSVMTAMRGLDVVDVSVSPDPAMQPTYGPVHSGPERAMRPDANTSTSAIAVLHDLAPQELRLAVYHNRFAAMPLEPSVLRLAGVTQFRLPGGAISSVESSWLEM